MIPNGMLTPYLPANGCPPGRMWQDRQCPSAARTSPLATDSALKLAGSGRSTGEMAARRNNKKKTAAQGRQGGHRDHDAPNRCTLPERDFVALRTRPITKGPPSPCGKSALPAKFNPKHLDESIGRSYRKHLSIGGNRCGRGDSNNRSCGCHHVPLR